MLKATRREVILSATAAAALGQGLGRHVDGAYVLDQLVDVARGRDALAGRARFAGLARRGLPVQHLQARRRFVRIDDQNALG